MLLPVAPGLGKRFHVVEPFAHGSTGTLYLADEPESGRRGILKVLAPVPRALQAERQRLRRELTKQATLEGAHIVSPFATGETDGQFWIFREWLEGVSLRVRIARQGALPQRQALSIAAQLAVALDDLHRAGLLHRDLTPGHILLDAQPEGLTGVRVIDAGLCAPIVHSGEATLLGTPGFVAPEQLAGKLVSFRSDLYALGAVLYEMLTGQPAFAGDTADAILAAQREGKHGPLPAGLPDGVTSLLRSLLGKDPQDRPFSAQKLRRTLDPYLPDGAPVTRQPTQTFANVSDTKKAPPREPTGTLRPPAAPASYAGKSTLLSMTGAPNIPGRASAPPPPPPQSRPPAPKADSTQRLEIDQILSTSPIAPRTSAPPPPRTSAPPAPPAPPRISRTPQLTSPGYPAPAAQPDPTQAVDFADILDEDEDDTPAPKQAEANAVLPSELTQPIRLEQVLAVGEARARRSLPPPQPKPKPEPARAAPEAAPAAQAPAPAQEPEAEPQSVPGFFAPVATAAAATAAAAPVADGFASSDSEPPTMIASSSALAGQLGGSDLSLDQTIDIEKTIDVEKTIERPAPSATAAQVAPADDEDEGDPDENEATSVAYKPAALAMVAQKSTLLGMGAGAAKASAQASAQVAPQTSVPSIVIEDTPTAGYERSEARPSTAQRFDTDPEDETLTTRKSLFGALAADSNVRKYGPYAVAAVLLLGIGSALVGGSGEEDPKAAVAAVGEAERSTLGSAPTTQAAAAAPTVEAKPMAEAPKVEPAPTVEPAPSVEAIPTSAAPVAVAAVQPAPPPPASARPAKLSAKEQKRQAAAAKAASKAAAKSSAKPAATKTADSNEARWAKAREEAQAHYAAKRYKEAAKAYETAAKYNPTHPGTFAGLGASKLKSNDVKGAVAAYQKAVQLSPTTSGFHAALGRAYATQGDKSKARAAYKRALELDPKNEAAKAALKEL